MTATGRSPPTYTVRSLEADGTAAADGEVADDEAAVDAGDALRWCVVDDPPEQAAKSSADRLGSFSSLTRLILGPSVNRGRAVLRYRFVALSAWRQARWAGSCGLRRGYVVPGGWSSAGQPRGSARSPLRCHYHSRRWARTASNDGSDERTIHPVEDRGPAVGPSAMPVATAC